MIRNSNATFYQNFKAIGAVLSEITCWIQTNIYIFIYKEDWNNFFYTLPQLIKNTLNSQNSAKT